MKYDDDFRKALIKIIKPLGRGGQAEVCKRTGLPSTVVCTIIKGRRPASELNKHKIAEAFGYSYSDFIGLGNDKKGQTDPKILPIGGRRRRDHDENFAKAVELLEQIYDAGEPATIPRIITIMENFLPLVAKRKTPGKF